MYKDFKGSPFYRNSQNPYSRTNSNQSGYNNNNIRTIELDPETRYGFKPMEGNYAHEGSEFGFESSENKGFDRKPSPILNHPDSNKNALKFYEDDNFFGQEEESCEAGDYTEMFQNMDRRKFGEMFVFSEIIGKPKALIKRR